MKKDRKCAKCNGDGCNLCSGTGYIKCKEKEVEVPNISREQQDSDGYLILMLWSIWVLGLILLCAYNSMSNNAGMWFR